MHNLNILQLKNIICYSFVKVKNIKRIKENIHFALCKFTMYTFLHKIQKCILLITNLCIVTYICTLYHDNGYLQYDHHTINITEN